MIFDDIYGNSEIKKQLYNFINSENIPHAFLFYGDDGIGKKRIARGFACLMMGLNEIREHPDIYIYSIKSSKKSLGIEDIRIIIEETNKKPYLSSKKIIIIDEFQKATEAAQNAFLKTLEEPNKNITIILIVENIKNILDTVKSRCQILKFKPLNSKELKSFLKKQFKNIDETKINSSIAFSQGIPKRAKMFLEDGFLNTLREDAFKILSFKAISFDEILKMDKILEKYKSTWEDLFTFILIYLRDVLFLKDDVNFNLLMNKDKMDEVYELSSKYDYLELFNLFQNVNRAIQMLKSNVNSMLVLEQFLIFKKEA